MGDDRPVEEVPDAVARLTQELADFKTTVMARVGRNPTGDVEPTFRSTAKAETLLCQGQAISRTTYAVLLQWATDQGLIGSVFGAGDGTTTFVLPDLRGRVLMGAGTLGPDTYALGALVGAARPVIAATNLPVHDHGTHGNHGHGGSGSTNTISVGDHPGHVNGTVTQPGYGVTADPSWTRVSSWGPDGGFTHSHTVQADLQASAGGHTAFGTASPTGLDVRQPGLVVNFLIWT